MSGIAEGVQADGHSLVTGAGAAQTRFGIYRDWRAETHTIYFDRIVFWDADPAGHPDWGVAENPTP